jgi:hypothetical protein
MAAVIGKVLTNPKALAAFADGMKSIEKVADKAGDLLGWQQAMNTFIQVFEPLAAPMQILAGQLSADVIPSVINLTTALMEQLQNPDIQNILNTIGSVFSFLIDKGAEAVGYLDDVINFFKTIGSFVSDKLAPFFEPTKTFLAQIGAFIDVTFKGFMDWMMNTVMPWFNTYLLPPIQGFVDFLTAFGTDVLNGLIIPAIETINSIFYQLWETLEKLTGVDINKFFGDIWNNVQGWFS